MFAHPVTPAAERFLARKHASLLHVAHAVPAPREGEGSLASPLEEVSAPRLTAHPAPATIAVHMSSLQQSLLALQAADTELEACRSRIRALQAELADESP